MKLKPAGLLCIRGEQSTKKRPRQRLGVISGVLSVCDFNLENSFPVGGRGHLERTNGKLWEVQEDLWSQEEIVLIPNFELFVNTGSEKSQFEHLSLKRTGAICASVSLWTLQMSL